MGKRMKKNAENSNSTSKCLQFSPRTGMVMRVRVSGSVIDTFFFSATISAPRPRPENDFNTTQSAKIRIRPQAKNNQDKELLKINNWRQAAKTKNSSSNNNKTITTTITTTITRTSNYIPNRFAWGNASVWSFFSLFTISRLFTGA
jgi:cytoskeletal protein RodZ